MGLEADLAQICLEECASLNSCWVGIDDQWQYTHKARCQRPLMHVLTWHEREEPAIGMQTTRLRPTGHDQNLMQA